MPAAIIGLFNSGSSILAKIVSTLGWNLGPPYWGDHYESQSLRLKLVRWWNEPHMEETVIQQERIDYLRQWLSQTSLQGTPVCAKHPLLCLSAHDLPIAWGTDVKYIRAYRDLDVSIARLAKRGWFRTEEEPHPAERIQTTLWEASERFFAAHDHLKCDYTSLLTDPRREVERLAGYLGAPLTDEQFAQLVGLIKRPI